MTLNERQRRPARQAGHRGGGLQLQQTAAVVRRRQLGPDAASEMLHLTQPHHLRRQDVQRRGLTLQALADILYHQHVFPLVFVVFHQPVGQLLRLRVFLMVRDGPRQRFGAQQRAAPAPQPFRRGAEKCLPGIERHQEMKTVKIAAPASRHDAHGVQRGGKLQVGCPRQHYFIHFTGADRLSRPRNHCLPLRIVG